VREGEPEDAIESASDADGGPEEMAVAEDHQQYTFCISRITSRVHVLDADGRPMGCNFKLADWEAQRDVGPPLPEPLLGEATLVSATDAFLREWTSLRATEQRQLVDQTLRLPLWKAVRQRKAENVHSTKRLRQRPVAAADGAPGACEWCGSQSTQGSAFCSPACEEKARVRSSMTAARNQIFAIEHGVCQVCGLDAHALYERVKALSPPERHQDLLRAGVKERKAMLENPQEGMFWQVDHIKPVAEGGGECDITNLRTLCTMCHAKETRRLQDRLRQAGWGKNSADVRARLLVQAAAAAAPEATAPPAAASRGGPAAEAQEQKASPTRGERERQGEAAEASWPRGRSGKRRVQGAALEASIPAAGGLLLPVLPEIDLGSEDDNDAEE